MHRPAARPLLALLTVPALLAPAALVGSVTAAPASAAPAVRTPRAGGPAIAFQQWDSTDGLDTAARQQRVRVAGDRVVLDEARSGRKHRRYAGTRYDVGRWVSPWVEPGFGLTQLVASWSATTPGDSWVEVRVRGRAPGGDRSSWDVLGRWTSGDSGDSGDQRVQRTSVSGQDDDLASVSVDTWKAHAAAGLTAYQLDVKLMRRTGATTPPPGLDSVGAVATRDLGTRASTSKPRRRTRRQAPVLAVPEYSQMVHRGHYPRWGGGGEAWCSPTSTSMVLGYYDALPAARTRRWVPAGHPDPWVDAAARGTYDAAYAGTGNWPFNTAYAAPLAGHGLVTRMASLRDAEKLVLHGIPVVASVAFGPGELSGAPISATDGHLLVISGFTRSGDVVVNDPAASSDAGVRRTYDRGQLERAWLGGSGGLAYVITDDAHRLPKGRRW